MPDWLHIHRPVPRARLRLLTFTHAGGAPTAFVPWSRALPDDVELLTAQLPGRGRRMGEAPIDDLSRLLDHLGPATRAAMDRPTVFLGHSMGAVVASELCHWLAARGHPGPQQLVLVAHRAPHVPLRRAPVYDAPDAAVIARLRRLGGTPAAVLDSAEMMSLFLPMIRADYRIVETWQPGFGRPLSCPVTTLAGARDATLPVADVAAWSEHTTGAFAAHVLDGGHFVLHTHLAETLHTLRDALAARGASARGSR